MAEDRKAELRRSAAHVFAERGYDRASMRDVAKQAGLSLAGMYHYYKSKEEMLFDIQHEAFQTLLGHHAEALAGVRDPDAKLEEVIGAHMAFFANNIAEMKVMSRESEQLAGEYASRVDELKRRYVRLVRGILVELGGAGPAPAAPGTAVFLLFGMMNWLYTWYDPERDMDPKVLAAAVKSIFLDGWRR